MCDIIIRNGEKLKCTSCHFIFAIKNDDEILFRNITLAYFNFKKKYIEVKCKNCKKIIKLDFFNFKYSNSNIK